MLSWPGLADTYLLYMQKEVLDHKKQLDATALKVFKTIFTAADNTDRCGERCSTTVSTISALTLCVRHTHTHAHAHVRMQPMWSTPTQSSIHSKQQPNHTAGSPASSSSSSRSTRLLPLTVLAVCVLMLPRCCRSRPQQPAAQGGCSL